MRPSWIGLYRPGWVPVTVEGPLKAAMEVLRSLRPALPGIVDFGGLLPRSHQDFIDRFTPMSFLLSAGPPASQVEQLAALLEAGIVEVCGPSARFGTSDRAEPSFVVSSPGVHGSRRTARALVEARAPGASLLRDTSPLLRNLQRRGLVSEYVITDSVTGEHHHTGGLAVTGSPYRVIDAAGRPARDLHAIGVVTENTRCSPRSGRAAPGRAARWAAMRTPSRSPCWARPRWTARRAFGLYRKPVVIVFALAAALCNAVSVTTRHLASVADPHRSAGWRLIIYLLRNPVWLLGWAAQAGAFVYALAAGGLAGVLLEQWALQSGPLRASQPFLVIIDPLVSIILSMWLFGEHFVPGALTVAVAVVAFAVMCAGVVVLTQTAPATMEPAASGG